MMMGGRLEANVEEDLFKVGSNDRAQGNTTLHYIHWFLLGFTFTGFYWGLLGFTGFYWGLFSL